MPFRGLQRQHNVSFQFLCSLRFALVAFQLYISAFCKFVFLVVSFSFKLLLDWAFAFIAVRG